MTETGDLNYPTSLLKIESSQQFRKGSVNLLDSNPKYNELLRNKVNTSISRVLNLNKNENGETYTIEFPEEVKKYVPDDIDKQISKDITGYQVRLFTAIVKLSEIARIRKALYVMEKIGRNAFDTNIHQIYKAMGAEKGRNRKDFESILENLTSLHRREFIYQQGEKIVIGYLVQIHGLDLKKKDDWKKTFTISIASCFNYKESHDKTYFNVPANLNQKLRELSSGRPNASVEILVKYLYQSKHCSHNNKAEYSYSTLFSIMNLEKYRKQQNHSRIKKTLKKAFETCIALGIVNKIEVGKNNLDEDKYTFYFS